ncbi:hypothetical protein GCM10010124_29920 [Pilimelia terevasa]|uniref:Uncharacterized protein n=1 Tax=Pilimelia terevasa TaxID=53372 RepID=A0A8J3BSU7_9ACTN|nr:hypothetical protein [Pilimelia terevasa]GGK35228.1 hypothetical protein GCM10010124_29920 [Pilimelia terevasa]
MSMITRLRDRRQAHRRGRAIERALENAKTPALKHEIQTLVARHLR